jgi:UDP-N-acetylglucosamine 2-epimerase
MRILQVVGARPQFIKLAPVSRSLAELRTHVAHEEIVAHTGQHYDAAMSGSLFAELGLAAPAINLAVGSGRHGEQTARMLTGLEAFMVEVQPDRVVVYGDTNSTVAGALAAAKLGVPLLHVEAGLRSFNRAMPEELNRIVVDHLADTLLAPTGMAVANLAREGLAQRTRLVGDVMCDAVLWGRERARSHSRLPAALGITGSFGVATVHRAENTTPAQLALVLRALQAVAAEHLPLVWPLHPRAREALRCARLEPEQSGRLRIIDPVGYLDMLALLDSAAVVLTDSGGLQKEAFIVGVPCVTLREETEWVETIEAGANRIAGTDEATVVEATATALGTVGQAELFRRSAREVYGGGIAARRVAEAILGSAA